MTASSAPHPSSARAGADGARGQERADGHQGDAARRRRLRWRARRGLLENDLVLTRFLDANEAALSDADVLGLDRLLDLTDNALLDLILARRDPDDALADPDARRVLARLRAA